MFIGSPHEEVLGLYQVSAPLPLPFDVSIISIAHCWHFISFSALFCDCHFVLPILIDCWPPAITLVGLIRSTTQHLSTDTLNDSGFNGAKIWHEYTMSSANTSRRIYVTDTLCDLLSRSSRESRILSIGLCRPSVCLCVTAWTVGPHNGPAIDFLFCYHYFVKSTCFQYVPKFIIIIIRPHRMHELRTIATDVPVAW